MLGAPTSKHSGEDMYRAKMRVAMEIKMMEDDLIVNVKQKFKYIVGHTKIEIRPGVNAEEAKFIKNIQNRILNPS
jgi:hypothetical protein